MAWTYIGGGTVDRSDAKKIEVRHSISRDEQSLNAFVNFLKLLHVINYKSLILLIDEFEYLFQKGSQRGAQFLNTFRFLYDRALERLSYKGDIANPIFIAACTPVIWDQIESDAENNVLGIKPFVDRALNRISLPTFDAAETKDLLLGRLEKWRIKKTGEKTGLFPFIKSGENDPFPFIVKICNGLPRIIFKKMAPLLDAAYDRKFKVIGLKEVKILAKDLKL